MDRQHNPQKTKNQMTNNDLQHTTQKTKDRVIFDFLFRIHICHQWLCKKRLKGNQNPYIDEEQT